MQCPRCHAQSRPGAQFCRECGARFEALCPGCGAKIEPGSRFCDSCGALIEGYFYTRSPERGLTPYVDREREPRSRAGHPTRLPAQRPTLIRRTP